MFPGASTAQAVDRAVRTALLGAQITPDVVARIDEAFVFREIQGLDIARVVALEIEAVARQYELEIPDSGIDPEILMSAIDNAARAGVPGSVREISRYVEKQIADELVDAKLAGATHVRFLADGDKIRVLRADAAGTA